MWAEGDEIDQVACGVGKRDPNLTVLLEAPDACPVSGARIDNSSPENLHALRRQNHEEHVIESQLAPKTCRAVTPFMMMPTAAPIITVLPSASPAARRRSTEDSLRYGVADLPHATENGAAAIAIGAAACPVTPPQPRGPMPAAVVRGVRQQRYRMRRQAKNDFRQYKLVLQKGLLFRGKAKLSLRKSRAVQRYLLKVIENMDLRPPRAAA